jgi:hypothetical protein
MTKRVPTSVSGYFQDLPKAVQDYFREQGARGGRIGGKRALETMTADERRARARKASKAAARARQAKARAKAKA